MMRVSGLLACAASLVLAIPALAEEGVGAEHMVMETVASEEAQAHFRAGLALLHNFEYYRAVEAFQKAQAADPEFAMAYWGEAMTHNHPLWDQQDREAAHKALAKLGATPEERSAKARTPKAKAWLDVVETLYAEKGTKKERDLAYLAKMKALHESDPSDIDARAFYGLAILGSSHGGRQISIYMRAAGVLEEGFMQHEMHPGVLHYLIHSYDDPEHAPLGERAAARYAKVAPNAGHAQHMVSHIFHALADWEASEAANINADAVVDRQRAARDRDPSFCGHYNEWLVYALLQQGKDASEIVDGCRADAQNHVAAKPEGRLGWGPASSYSKIAAWLGVATGNWADPLDGLGEGFLLARYNQAQAGLLGATDDGLVARASFDEMQALAEQIQQVLKEEDPLNSYAVPWLERELSQAAAIVELAEGRKDDGMALLREAAEAESAMPVVFGPPAMAKPSWELLGELLLADGKYSDAAEAFEKSLAFAPGRILSVQGLEAAQSAGE